MLSAMCTSLWSGCFMIMLQVNFMSAQMIAASSLKKEEMAGMWMFIVQLMMWKHNCFCSAHKVLIRSQSRKGFQVAVGTDGVSLLRITVTKLIQSKMMTIWLTWVTKIGLGFSNADEKTWGWGYLGCFWSYSLKTSGTCRVQWPPNRINICQTFVKFLGHSGVMFGFINGKLSFPSTFMKW